MELTRCNEYLQQGATGKRLILESETDHRPISTLPKNSPLAPFISQRIITKAAQVRAIEIGLIIKAQTGHIGAGTQY